MVNCKNCKYWDSGVMIDKKGKVGMCNLSATDSGFTYHPDNRDLPYMFKAQSDANCGTLLTGENFGCVAGVDYNIETGCFN